MRRSKSSEPPRAPADDGHGAAPNFGASLSDSNIAGAGSDPQHFRVLHDAESFSSGGSDEIDHLDDRPSGRSLQGCGPDSLISQDKAGALQIGWLGYGQRFSVFSV